MLARAVQANECLEELYLKNNSLKDTSGQLFSEYTRYKHNILKLGLEINPMNFKYLEIVRENLLANYQYQKKMLVPRLQKIIQKIQFKGTAFEELNERISQKQKERNELEAKLKSKGLKLEDIKNSENEKFEEIRKEYNNLRDISLNLSNEIEEIHSQHNVRCK